MKFLNDLIEAYDNNQDIVGKVQNITNMRYGSDKEPAIRKIVLEPVSFIGVKGYLEISIDTKSNFVGAELLQDDILLLPNSIDSGSRGGKDYSSFGLFDKMEYATNLCDYVKSKASKQKFSDEHNSYMALVKDWCKSSYSFPRLNIVYEYVKKDHIIEDLLGANTFGTELGENLQQGILGKVNKIGMESLNIGFNVIDDNDTKLDYDKNFFKSWQGYYLNYLENSPKIKKDIDYISGEKALITSKVDNKIIKAAHPKLISFKENAGQFNYSNDIFRSKVNKTTELLEQLHVNIGYVSAQKSMNMLRYLVKRQGITYGNDPYTILIWGNNKLENTANKFLQNKFSFLGKDITKDKIENFKSDVSKQIKDIINGSEIEVEDEKINILILDAITAGRISILYYNTLDGKQFLKRIRRWSHYGKVSKYVPSISSVVATIYKSDYKSDNNDKLYQKQLGRFTMLLLRGQNIPRDMINTLYRKVIKTASYQKQDNWRTLWQKDCNVLISMINYNNREENVMTLDIERDDRDYLFGRLLAVADKIENHNLRSSNLKRTTKSTKNMSSFVQKPATNWLRMWVSLENIELVKMKRDPKSAWLAIWFENRVSQILEKLDNKMTDKPLSPNFLIGFSAEKNYKNEKGEIQNDK